LPIAPGGVYKKLTGFMYPTNIRRIVSRIISRYMNGTKDLYLNATVNWITAYRSCELPHRANANIMPSAPDTDRVHSGDAGGTAVRCEEVNDTAQCADNRDQGEDLDW